MGVTGCELESERGHGMGDVIGTIDRVCLEYAEIDVYSHPKYNKCDVMFGI